MMRLLRHPDWTDRYPYWRPWHTFVLYLFGLALAALGCMSMWGGLRMIPDRFSPRHVVGLPFVGLGVGLILHIPAAIALTVVLFLAFSALVTLSQLTSGTPDPGAMLLIVPAMVFAVGMFKGMKQERQGGDSNNTPEDIRR